MSSKGLNVSENTAAVTHLVSRTACWAVIAWPHRSTAPPARASRWSTAWTTPRTCKRSRRHQAAGECQMQMRSLQLFISRMTEGRTAHRSALTNTISNFWPDSLMVRYDSTRTRVKLRQGGHWKKRNMSHKQHQVQRNHWCFWSLEGHSVDLCLLLLRIHICCLSFSSLSRVLLFHYFQVGFPPKRLYGLDSTLIHQINQ